MPKFKVAHVREQGIDLIIIPLEHHFGQKTKAEQDGIIAELQVHATGAGLAGTVVPVWPQGSAMSFIAPHQWHPFFKGISLQWVGLNINKEIFWDD
jgi:hypothetical protein